MPTVTEIATIPLKADATFEDSASPAGKVWASVVDTIAEQNGYQRLYYGREVEDSKNLHLVVDWDTLESHQNFINSPTYGPFLKNIGQIQEGDIKLVHTTFDAALPTGALANSAAPFTEIIFAFLATHDEEYAAKSAKFAKLLQSNADVCKAHQTGWAIEEVNNNGSKAHAYVSFLAWESVEKHAAFRETTGFTDNISLVSQGIVGLSVAHAAFKSKD